VSAPTRVPLPEIHLFVKQKARWIELHLQRQKDELATHQEKQFGVGESLLFLGKVLTLNAVDRQCNVPYYDATHQTLSLSEADYKKSIVERKRCLELWYVKQAAEYIEEKVQLYSAVMGVQPTAIKIRYYKSRWGSCNRRGQLQFNWALMMAPAPVVDYVIVHELAHLTHFNHSPAFWQVVASIIPDHKKHRHWLKNQRELIW
jgi:predicted metal-dependent hydrolase